MASDRIEHRGRIVRLEYVTASDTVLCAIIDTGEGDIAAVMNARWGRPSVLAHVVAHLDAGVPGAVVCDPGCPD